MSFCCNSLFLFDYQSLFLYFLRLNLFYCSVSDKGWQEWNAQFFLPSHKKGFKYVQILFKGPKHHVDIVIDDMVLEELPLEKDWLQAVKARTEKLRKRDVTIRYVGDRFLFCFRARWDIHRNMAT